MYLADKDRQYNTNESYGVTNRFRRQLLGESDSDCVEIAYV